MINPPNTITTIRLGARDEVRRLLVQAREIGRPDKYAGKRKKTRLKGQLWVEVRTTLDDQGGAGIQASSHDISEEGMSIILRKKAQVGDMLYIRDCSDGKIHPWVKIKVTHCVNVLKGYLVGGPFQFDKQL